MSIKKFLEQLEYIDIPHGPAIWVHFCAFRVTTTVVVGGRVIPFLEDLGGAFADFLEF